MVVTTERVWYNLHERMRHFIGGRVADAASAEDILQDVFLTIHARIGSLRDEERLESWVFQIVRHAIADHHRARRPTVALPLEIPAPEDEEIEERAAVRLSSSIRGMVAALAYALTEILGALEDLGADDRLPVGGVAGPFFGADGH